MRKYFYIGCLSLAVAMAACGGGEPTKESGGGGTTSGGKETPAPAAAMATLMGKIVFDGKAPDAKKLQTASDPKCPQDGSVKSEEVIASDGGLENVMVYVSSPVDYKGASATTEQVVEQVGCHYVPHVFTVMVGQPVKIKNGDETNHNIHALSEKQPKQINIAQNGKGIENTEKFEKVETFKVKCDVHSWMGAQVGVFDHPYHAVSGKGGEYTIKLPAGEYDITVRHEKYGTQVMKVKVGDGMTHQDFTFKADAAAKSGN